ncbi:MAG: CoA transferase, partial [Stellaceae bacterium]
MGLLTGFRVVELGGGMASAVCGRLFADVGADVACLDPGEPTPLGQYLDRGKSIVSDEPAAA